MERETDDDEILSEEELEQIQGEEKLIEEELQEGLGEELIEE